MKHIVCNLLAIIGVLATQACNQGPRQPEAPPPGDVSQAQPAAPVRVSHGSFALKQNQEFPFEVPPHVIAPRLQGSFSSSTTGPDGSDISDEAADVELMVMTEGQHQDYVGRRSAESLDAIEPSHNHAVSIALPPTQDEPARYYAVFRRAGAGKNPIKVKADLIADFGSL